MCVCARACVCVRVRVLAGRQVFVWVCERAGGRVRARTHTHMPPRAHTSPTHVCAHSAACVRTHTHTHMCEHERARTHMIEHTA